MTYKHVCKYCGKEFESNTRNRVYCSRECRTGEEFKRKEIKQRAEYYIFERDYFRCAYCGKSSIEDDIRLVIEHIIPRGLGGDNSMFNLVTSCEECNQYKFGDMLHPSVLIRMYNRNIYRNKGISEEKEKELIQYLDKKYKIETKLYGSRLDRTYKQKEIDEKAQEETKKGKQ